MKKFYFEPEISVIPFALGDIITLSLSENVEGMDDSGSVDELFG